MTLDDSVFNMLKENNLAQFKFSSKVNQAFKLVENMYAFKIEDN